jgi:hypothetical protein
LQVIDPETGITRSASDIYENLKKIIEHCANDEEDLGLGILTTENRDIWSDCYSSLIKSKILKKNSIQSNIFHSNLII